MRLPASACPASASSSSASASLASASFALCLALCLTLGSGTAYADPLAPSSGEYYMSLNGASYQAELPATTVNGYYHVSSPDASTGAYLLGGSDPSVGSFVGSYDAAAYQGVSASAYAYYEVEVLGPAAQTVNLDVVGTLLANSSNLLASSQAYANLAIVLPSDPASPDDGYALQTLLNVGNCAGLAASGNFCSGPATDSATLNVNQSIAVLTDTAYLVELYSYTAQSGTLGGGAASSVDPTITLATPMPGYSLAFSAGTMAATPEPSSLAMTMTGLTAGVAALRRMRARKRAAGYRRPA